MDFEINANPVNIYENKDRFKKKATNESLLSKNEIQRIKSNLIVKLFRNDLE